MTPEQSKKLREKDHAIVNFIHSILRQLRIVTPLWWGVIGAACLLLLLLRHDRRQMPGNLLIVYILFVLSSTVLARTTGGRTDYLINLDLIGTWVRRIRADSSQQAELILNFFMLLPVGVLFPWATNRKLIGTVLFGLGLILLIEFAQLLTKRGWFELCDIVDNTLGVVLGYGLYCLGKRLTGERKA